MSGTTNKSATVTAILSPRLSFPRSPALATMNQLAAPKISATNTPDGLFDAGNRSRTSTTNSPAMPPMMSPSRFMTPFPYHYFSASTAIPMAW